MVFQILILTSFVLSTSAYSCLDTKLLNPPTDLTQPLYYPSDWNANLPVPTLDYNQTCFMTIRVPSGYYANVTFYRQIPRAGGSYVLYPNNKLKILEENDTNPYIFSFPHFKLSVTTGATQDTDGQFAFKVVYTSYPSISKKKIDIYPGKPPVVVYPNQQLTTFVGNKNSAMSLMGFSLIDPTQRYLLRQSLIFGGDSFYDDFIGTLDLVLSADIPLTDYGNKISVYTFGLSNIINYPLFMGSDAQDVRRYQKYQGENCPSTGDCTIRFDGQYGDSLWVTDYDGSEIIKGFDTFPSAITVNVYENSISNSTRIASLTSNNYLSQLPLEVKGTMKFYEVIGYGTHNMTVTRDTTTRASRISV